jgi:Leucine-rich repeat (LRR) protein
VLPSGIGALTGLASLTLSGCRSLTSLAQQQHDSFGQLTGLTQLDLSFCCSLDGLPDDFSQLRSLCNLNLSKCRLAANSLPIWHLQHLQTLDLGYCLETSSIPGVVSQLTALRQLVVTSTTILTLPDEIRELRMLQELVMNDCEALSSLPDSLGQLRALTSIEISGSSLSELPGLLGGLWTLPALRMLRVVDCRNFAVVPAAIGRLSTLEVLHVQGCASLTSLPNSMYRLTNLQELNLSDCTSLASLPSVLIALSSLTRIMLSNCSSLAGKLFSTESTQCFDQLRELHLDGCSRLQMVDRMYSASLTWLSLAGCSSLQVLPHFGGIPNLVQLILTGCSSLQQLPDSLGALSNLVELNASDCSNLANLPGTILGMSMLKRLKLRSCNSLQTLPNDLPSLKLLDLSYCSEMSALSEALIRLRKQLNEAGTLIAVEGWREFLSMPPTASGLVDLEDMEGLFITPNALSELQAAINIHALIKDREFVLELLNRLSWLGVLLGAATFAGALAPPGGYDSGLLFADYSPADCRPRGANQTAPFTSLVYCNTSGPKQNCSISDADPGGCIKRPNQCSNIDGVSCNAKPNAAAVISFLMYDVLSFGFSMALILFVVAGSIPKRRAREPAAAAGLIWLSLIVAYSLLYLAVSFGVAAVYSAMTAVLPVQTLGWSIVAALLRIVTAFPLGAGLRHLLALSPGAIAVRKAVRTVIDGIRSDWSARLALVMGLVRLMLARCSSLAGSLRRQAGRQAPQGP